VITELKERQHGATAYFFCRYRDPDRNLALSIHCIILDQLLTVGHDLIPYCYQKRLEKGGDRLQSLELCKEILGVVVRNTPRIFLVVDGLDECDEEQRKLFLDYIIDLVGKCDCIRTGSLRIAIFSREEPDIKKRLASGRTIAITQDDVGRDIKAYVAHHSCRLQETHGLNDGERDYIQEHVSDRADGETARDRDELIGAN
jgi:hypothetical protein